MRRLAGVLLLVSGLCVSTQAARADCSAEVDAAFGKLRELSAFRMETTIVNEQGSLRMAVDYLPPDRMHQTVDTGTDAGTVQLIVIGSEAWSNQGHGWAKMPEKFANEVAGQMRQSLAARQHSGTNYECLGEQTFEGKTYLAYRASLPAVHGNTAAEPPPPNVQTVYIDKVSGLPVRNIVTPGDKPDTRLFDGTFQVRDGLKIEAPTTQ